MVQEIAVDLRRAPSDRWRLTVAQQDQARELFKLYTTDLGLSPDLFDMASSTAKELIAEEYWLEMEALASTAGLSVGEVAVCNLYYDALKVVLGKAFGCSAFAMDAPDGPLHARNLDWWTEESKLSRYTAVCHFKGGGAGDFTTIGWPGFIGAFSGIAPGRFAVTLNAVLSSDAPELAPPVVLLLRSVLSEAGSFEEALRALCDSPIPCDCLLLLTGTRQGEIAVIERTPLRHAVREPEGGFVCVTNGYVGLAAGLASASTELLATSCHRLDRMHTLIRHRRPQSPEDCFRYLSDADIRMNMTVQQMVFQSATGRYWVHLPDAAQSHSV